MIVDGALHVLLVEDAPFDAELAIIELRRYGFVVDHRLVEDRPGLEAALEERSWDIVLTDHSLPRLSSSDVLALLRVRELELPCIVVSGAVGEEAAVSFLHNGAVDYVNKERLERLGPAVDRALREVAVERARRAAEKALKRAKDELEQRVEERTAELRRANTRLREENAVRQRIEIELQGLRARLADLRERERRFLARELHDSALQRLIGISYDLAGSRRLVPARVDDEEARQAIDAAFEQHRKDVLEVASLVRQLIGGLRPAGLDDLGLVATLGDYVAQLRHSQNDCEIDLVVDPSLRARDLPPLLALALFRTVQEALRNTLKHAHADRVEVHLEAVGDGLTLHVRDNGRGFEVPDRLSTLARHDHFGLIGIEEHVASVGGTLAIRSEAGRGTEVSAQVPLAEDTKVSR